jgi:hypothetical protein
MRWCRPRIQAVSADLDKRLKTERKPTAARPERRRGFFT